MELPLSVTRAGAKHVALPGLTKNISSTGVLFMTASAPDLGGSIEYIITLDGARPVSLRCIGKVLRSAGMQVSGEGRGAYEIAATLERYEFVREPERRPSALMA